MRTIAYNEEAVPRRKNNHSMGTRLLPSVVIAINTSPESLEETELR
jgi:hypothetical protein